MFFRKKDMDWTPIWYFSCQWPWPYLIYLGSRSLHSSRLKAIVVWLCRRRLISVFAFPLYFLISSTWSKKKSISCSVNIVAPTVLIFHSISIAEQTITLYVNRLYFLATIYMKHDLLIREFANPKPLTKIKISNQLIT